MLDMTARPNYGTGQIQQIADDWELVLCETQHRMKNTLMLLSASVRRSFSGAESKGLPAAVERFEKRIVAFGRLYQLLSSGEHNQVVDVADYFENLSEALLKAILEPVGIRCEASVEEGTLPVVQAHRVGLIIAELVTNAVKHAFPNKEGGLVGIEAIRRDGRWSFTVIDNGAGATGSPLNVGGRIVQSLAKSIQAEVSGHTGAGGTTVTLLLPAFD